MNNSYKKIKWINITKVPTAKTIWEAVVWVRHNADKASDQQLIKAYKYASIANYLLRRRIEPKSYRHFRDSHIIPQCGNADALECLRKKLESRNLLDTFGLDIHIQ